MKARKHSAMLGSIALIAAFSPMAVSMAADAGAGSQMAETEALPPGHDAYLQRVRAEMGEWRVKLDKFADRAAAKSQEARKAAAADLNEAWRKTRDAAARLETASAADWESAKASFKKASDELAAAWSKAVAEAK